MQFSSLHAVVINRRNSKDSDRFYTLFTLERGKLDVYARGVRSIKSKRSSSLDLYSQIICQIVEKGEYKTLTSVELVSSNRQNKAALYDISRLFQIGELIDELLPEDDPHIEVYELLTTALTHLSRFDSPEYLLRFKKKLLTLLGYWNTSLADDQIDGYLDTLLSRPLRAKII